MLTILFLLTGVHGLVNSAQGDSATPARELIEKLRSENVEVRNGARRKLKELGKSVKPELEKAAQDRDPDVAATARELLRVLSVSDKLSPRLKKLMPGLDERLASGDETTWTAVLIEAVSERDGKPIYPNLEREDLEPLAAMAVRGAKTRALKDEVLSIAAARSLQSAAPEIVKLLQDKEEHVSEIAAFYLGYLGAKEAVPGLVQCLLDADPGTRRRAARALGQLGAKEAIPILVKLLEASSADLRKTGVKGLAKLRSIESIPVIIPLIKDPQLEVRIAAASWLCDLGVADGVPVLLDHPGPEGLSWEESPPLTFLNALRRPEAWRTLAQKTVPWKLTGSWGLEGTRKQILELLAKEAGVALEGLPEKEWADSEEQVQKWVGPATLPEGFLIVLSGSGYEAILETDRIRLIAHDEALKFWQAWWKDQDKKK